MDDLRKAAEMALEALEDSMYPQKKQFDAIVGLKQALAQEEQEPVAWMYVNEDGECEQIEYGALTVEDPYITLLYTAPPSKPWVSLTDEEIENLELPNKPTVKEFVQFIEAALRSKNNG